MAGHSPWANIKHKKALIDKKRGKVWSKLSKAIIVAAKGGGGDPITNLRLRYAIDDAKAVSMPKENITRAIKRGTGELEGGNLESSIYEGVALGVGILCEILTDNPNRTAPEIRKLFEVHGGALGKTGCVAWMFDSKGLILVDATKISEDALVEIVIEAGGDDVKLAGPNFEILTATDQLQPVKEALAAKQIPMISAELSRIPNTTIDLDLETSRSVLALMEKLDDHDDTQNVFANFTISEAVMAELGEE